MVFVQLSRLAGLVVAIGVVGFGVYTEIRGGDGGPLVVLAILAALVGSLPWALTERR